MSNTYLAIQEPFALHPNSSTSATMSSMLESSPVNHLLEEDQLHRRPDAAARRVRFSDKIRGTLIPSLKEMSAEEQRAVWYNDDDMKHFMVDTTEDQRHMRRCLSLSVSPETEFNSSRGIEHLASNKILKRLCRKKTAAIGAVLIEQHRQKMCGSNDPLLLAAASLKKTLKAKQTAIAHAAIDQEFVLSMYMNEFQQGEIEVNQNQECTRLSLMMGQHTQRRQKLTNSDDSSSSSSKIHSKTSSVAC